MTLAEVMTAIAIAGIIALLMVQVMNCVNATMRSTTNLNKRLAYEGKVADNLQTADADIMTDAQLASYSVQINYGSGTLNIGNDFTPGGNTIRITEYTCKYDDVNYTGAQANYHFLVAAPFSYRESERPTGNFVVRLIIDDDVRTVDHLEEIEITGAGVNATYSFDSSVSGTGFTGGFVANPIIPPGGGSPAMMLPTEKNVIPGSDVTTTSAYCIDIPVIYPANIDVMANAASGRGQINVKLKMSRTSAHDASIIKEYDFSEMLLDYCTASQITLPDGTPSVQYYPLARTNAAADEVGATYNLHKDGSVTVIT